jgi:hypothetical protein
MFVCFDFGKVCDVFSLFVSVKIYLINKNIKYIISIQRQFVFYLRSIV